MQRAATIVVVRDVARTNLNLESFSTRRPPGRPLPASQWQKHCVKDGNDELTMTKHVIAISLADQADVELRFGVGREHRPGSDGRDISSRVRSPYRVVQTGGGR